MRGHFPQETNITILYSPSKVVKASDLGRFQLWNRNQMMIAIPESESPGVNLVELE